MENGTLTGLHIRERLPRSVRTTITIILVSKKVTTILKRFRLPHGEAVDFYEPDELQELGPYAPRRHHWQ